MPLLFQQADLAIVGQSQQQKWGVVSKGQALNGGKRSGVRGGYFVPTALA